MKTNCKNVRSRNGKDSAEYKKIEKKTKSDLISYEMQVEAINFYIRALESAIRIAEQYAKTYDSVGNMFGIAMAIGAIEILMWWKTDRVKCAGINIGTSAIGMGLAKKASGIAKGMAGEFKDQKAKLERIRDLFHKHFGKEGGLSQFAMQSGKNLKVNPRGPSGVITSATGSEINIKKENFKSVGCVDSEGNAEKDCSCKINNSCLSISPPPILNKTKIGRTLKRNLDIDETFSESNSIMSGDLSVTSLNGSSLAARFEKTQKVTKKLVEQINKKHKNKLKKAKIDLKFPNDKMLATYLNKVMPPNKRIGGTKKFMSQFLGGIDPKDIKETQKKLSAGLNQDGLTLPRKRSLLSKQILAPSRCQNFKNTWEKSLIF